MAIVRSGSRGTKARTHSSPSTQDGLPGKQQQSRSVGRGTSVDESDGSGESEPMDAGVEICQVGDHTCAVPFEIFDLSDLKQILSLDTWNFCLTEEERESLFSLLPDMDEESYRRTLKELFAAGNINFCSPLTDLFQQLREGLCHPQVVHYRESLKYLQRKEHYHHVRKYHNRMVNQFLQMRYLWESYPDASMEERIEIWTSRKLNEAKPQFNGLMLGPFRSRGLLKRKAKLLKCKEHTKAPHLFLDDAPAPAQAVLPQMDSEEVEKSTVDKNANKDVALNIEYGQGDLTRKSGKSEKTDLKGVHRTLTQGSSRSDVKLEIDKSHVPECPVSSSLVEDECLSIGKVIMNEPALSPYRDAPAVLEKSILKMKSKKKIKGTGKKREISVAVVRKRKRVKETDENDSRMAHRELNLSGKTLLIDSINKELRETPVEVEQMPFDLDDCKSGEPQKKYKRRGKVKDESPGGQAESVTETQYNGVTDVGEKWTQESLLESKELSIEGAGDKPTKRRKKRLKSENNGSVTQPCTSDGEPIGKDIAVLKSPKKLPPPPVPPVSLSFPFSVIHLVSAVRMALTTSYQDAGTGAMHMEGASVENGGFLMSPEAGYFQADGQPLQCDDPADGVKEQDVMKSSLPAIPLQELVKRVQVNPGDPRILQSQEPLQWLVRGVLKVLSSKTTQPGIKGWKPFVAYDKVARGWSWIGPLPSQRGNHDYNEVEISVEAWAVTQKILYKIQELFGNWMKHEQEILQQLGQLSLPTPPQTPILPDEKERFRELRAQKSLMTINPTSEEMRAYFRREEALRYSVPDRAFFYTSVDGRKSVVAPLRRIGGKPNSKARDHFMLKSDRPPHVTILCLVRDAAARLPGSIGTRADVCALIRDSQYIVEDVSDAQLNQVVSGALDRLHYEQDPCVRFDGDRKLWVYLHTDRDEEDFEDDATSSTKKWKRSKKDGTETPDFSLAQEYDYSVRDDQDPCGLGLDFDPTSCFGGPGDLSSVYSSTGRAELLYSHPNEALASPRVLGTGFPGQVREDGMLPFIELPPSIQPPCVNMQQSHPMGWEVLGNRWNQETHFTSGSHLVQEDCTATALSQREHWIHS